MTDEQHMQEVESYVVCVLPSENITLPISTSTTIIPITTAIIPVSPIINHKYLTITKLYQKQLLNFLHGTAAVCLDKLVRHTGLMQARERVKNEKQECKSVVEQIKEKKGAVSTGKTYDAGAVRIGKQYLILT